MMRRVLLATAQNQWLRDHAPRYRFIQKAAARFMPGEDMEQGLAAAQNLKQHGISAILTQLGENVTDAAEAEGVMRHYLQVLDRIQELKLDAEISIKLTQLGLDLGAEQCLNHAHRLAARSGELGKHLWIDMESSTYTEPTLALVRRLRMRCTNVGVCLQSYLYRTASDLAELLPLGIGIRLVKGAYREPPAVAYPHKKDVNDNFFRLALQLLSPEARATNTRAAFATHDLRLIQRIERAAEEASRSRSEVEFEFLYGIQRAEQVRLAQAGHAVRVLISYGTQWFPWFMRRLAERPANLAFVMRNLFS